MSKRKATPEPDTQRQATDLAAFRRMMQVSSGTFSLSIAVCQDATLRQSLITLLSAEFPGTLVITLPSDVPDVLAHVQSQLPPTTPQAIFLLGMESSIPSESETQRAIRVLNSSREAWEHIHCPIVFWLAEYALTKLARHAPDFWRYFSHHFEFISDAPSLTQAQSESAPGQAMIDGLPFEEKLFRISELERRLQEAGPTPSSELQPHVVDWRYELAKLYIHRNRFTEAETLLRQNLDWATETHKEASPHTALAFNNLAMLLKATNRLGEAELLVQRALAIDEASYGQDHSIVAIHLNNLAQLLKEMNRLGEAERLMRRALAIDETNYGKDHPEVAIDLSNLARLLQEMTQLAEAEPLMRRALDISEVSYGQDHPLVATDLSNLAALLKETNRLGEAEPLMRRALGIDEASYGQDHPNVAIRLSNLAALLKATNRLEAAEPLMRRAVGILVGFTVATGHQHPHLLGVERNYRNLLVALGKTEEEVVAEVGEVLAPLRGGAGGEK